ncbi:predicted protein [Plenodomus lingam JN3]|uniref:Predicted protein n=1 Tax=Leptosphaeria maculans (strain JN3 / isolate v23.1.3 / race Av1-4-5-6-7-8) TaxID=985895 RepID=E4ZZ40_LEPMJ|nr:predicted protein [Plenodomus lingam JN3]CBX96475.1 predicted protein [Plenodomus lingam JN3]
MYNPLVMATSPRNLHTLYAGHVGKPANHEWLMNTISVSLDRHLYAGSCGTEHGTTK